MIWKSNGKTQRRFLNLISKKALTSEKYFNMKKITRYNNLNNTVIQIKHIKINNN